MNTERSEEHLPLFLLPVENYKYSLETVQEMINLQSLLQEEERVRTQDPQAQAHQIAPFLNIYEGDSVHLVIETDDPDFDNVTIEAAGAILDTGSTYTGP